MQAKLILEDKTVFEAQSFGAPENIAGEVVFSTGMMGYPESLTDPSYKGQILVLTYPLVGNYGIPDKVFWESDSIQVSGLIVSNYIDTPSHFQSQKTLAQWFGEENKPLLEIKDTRLLTQKIRDKGSMLGKIIVDDPEQRRMVDWYDPNKENLVAQVSTKKIIVQKNPLANAKAKTVLLIDCGAKLNIQRALLKRNVNVITIPWDFNPFERKDELEQVILNSFQDLKMLKPASTQRGEQVQHDKLFDGLLISNGPGDPVQTKETIAIIKQALQQKFPTLGICLGHQLLNLAAGGKTKKLKFGHRSQNQPCTISDAPRCYITTQNHGFAVDEIPKGFKSWFTNANDGSNEGVKHTKFPFMSVQFHPEATPGPTDTEWVFDYFLDRIDVYR